MDIGANIAAKLLQYKQRHHLSTVELAAEMHLAVSTTQEYLNGNGNPRAGTLELLAQQMGISVVELISDPAPKPEPAYGVLHIAQEFASLPPDKRGRAISLFIELTALWSSEQRVEYDREVVQV